jgi:hypothetical protein
MTRLHSILVSGFIALALSVCWFYQMRPIAEGNGENTINGFQFTGGSGFGSFNSQPVVWKPRIGGYWLSGTLLDAVAWWEGNLTPEQYANVFGFYNAAGLMATFLLLIRFVKHAQFIILGTFAALVYSLTPPASSCSYDMPALFFFTLSFLLWQRGWFGWMLAAIVAGTLFKETVAVVALLFFFTKLGWKTKAGFFISAAVACLLLKLWITAAVLGHAQLSTAEYADWPRLKRVFTGSPGPFGGPVWLRSWVWMNAGTVIVALFMLPGKTLADRGIKTVLAVFMVGQLIGGDYGNFRDFLEIIPMTMIYLANAVEGGRAT